MTDHLNPELLDLLRHFKLDRTYVQGRGSWLTDSSGRRVLDLSSQYGALPFGHNPRSMWKAIETIQRKETPSFVQPSRPVYAEQLAKELAERIPLGNAPSQSVVSFAQSGSEAIEIALRLCRLSTKRALIAGATRGYHGHTTGAAALSWQSAQQLNDVLRPPGFTHIEWNDRDALEKLFKVHGPELAALVLEPLQGEGGVFEGNGEYFRRAYELCQQYGAKLVLDEVQTGLGRLGAFLGSTLYGARADVVVLSKALGGGLVALGACIAAKSVWSEEFALSHGSTFANNNLACAVGLAVLELLDENDSAILKNAQSVGVRIRQRFETLIEKYPGVISEIRGRACLFAIEFDAISPESSFLVPYLFKTGGWNGLIASYLLNVHGVRVIPSLTRVRALRIQPSLNINERELEQALDAFEALIKVIYFQDWSCLVEPLLNDDLPHPKLPIDCRNLKRPVQSAIPIDSKAPGRFAFLIHNTSPEDLVDTSPALGSLDPQELESLYHWISKFPGHAPLCFMPGINGHKASAQGWLLGLSHTPESMRACPQETLVNDIQQAVNTAEELGAQVIGLGAFTSIMTGNGSKVATRAALTTGSALTVAMAVDGLKLACNRMNVDYRQTRGLIIGLGVVGSAAAVAASDFLPALILTGNPKWPQREHVKAVKLMDKIYARAATNLMAKSREGLPHTLRLLLPFLSNLGPRGRILRQRLDEFSHSAHEELAHGLAKEITWAYHAIGRNAPIQFATKLDAVIHHAEVVIAASSAATTLIGPHDLRTGAIVCDIAKPADVCRTVMEIRNDVLVFDGGLVRYPDAISFGPNMGYEPGINLACLTETIVLALENHRSGSFGVGRGKDLMSLVSHIRDATYRHGFSVGQLRVGRRILKGRDLEFIGEAARRRSQSPAQTRPTLPLSA